MPTEAFLLECEQYLKNKGIIRAPHRRQGGVCMRRCLEIDISEADFYLEKNKTLLFQAQLFAFIDRSGEKDSDIYKKARIDRRLFSKIRSNPEYIPCKKTVLAFCLALELPRADADLLLSSAGYSLSRADDYDLVIAFCIEKRLFDFFEINEVLDHFGFDVF